MADEPVGGDNDPGDPEVQQVLDELGFGAGTTADELETVEALTEAHDLACARSGQESDHARAIRARLEALKTT